MSTLEDSSIDTSNEQDSDSLGSELKSRIENVNKALELAVRIKFN